jgi:dolichol-phosphate mannosyltransferase
MAARAGSGSEERVTRPRVLCVAPAWNEGERIRRVIAAVPRAVVDAVVVVDDGSSDDTASHAEAAGAIVLRHQRNRGVGAAIRSGVDYARQHGFEIVVVISGGGKTPPHQIPQLLEPLLRGEADFVQGSRYMVGGETRHMPMRRRLGTRAYTHLFSLFVRRRVTDASSGFRAFRTSLLADERINLWQSWLDRYELEPYLLFKSLRLGHAVREVPVAIEYPTDHLAYTKMRAVTDWWRIFRPVVLLGLGLRR